MKIAVCLSGEFRTGAMAFSNIKQYIGNLWDQCDFFIHTWDTESYAFLPAADSSVVSNNIGCNQNYLIDKTVLTEYYSLYQPAAMVVGKGLMVPFLDHRLYSIRYCLDLMNEYSRKNEINYDIVIRIRPDLLFNFQKSTLTDDIKNCTDKKTFYFGLIDIQDTKEKIFENEYPHIHSEFWIGSPDVIIRASTFNEVMENRHTDHQPSDGLLHMGIWLRDGLGLKLQQIHTQTTVYRHIHAEKNLSSLTVNYDIFPKIYFRHCNNIDYEDLL